MEKYEDDWKTILQNTRQLRNQMLMRLLIWPVNNFIEMRDKAADPKFLLQKKIEAKLHEKYPDKWIPAYSQVTFSPTIRYSEALERGNQQEAIMQEVMQQENIHEKWDDEKLMKELSVK